MQGARFPTCAFLYFIHDEFLGELLRAVGEEEDVVLSHHDLNI
jgi:hypothetical protein